MKYNARSWKEHFIEKIVFIRSLIENDEKFFKKYTEKPGSFVDSQRSTHHS